MSDASFDSAALASEASLVGSASADRLLSETPNPKRKLPLTEKRLAANRANAAKSTGPRTQEGKSKSALNALTHGLRARLSPETLVPDHEREDFTTLTTALDGPSERMRNLIERLDDDALNDPNRVPFLIGLSVAEAFSSRLLFGHLREEHEPAIWAFIGRSGSIAS